MTPISDRRIEHAQPHRLPLLMKALGAGVWDLDIARDRLSCDRRWYEIVGRDPDVHPVRRIDDFKPFIHPDDVEMATLVDLAAVNRLIALDERYHIEFRIIRPSGEIRHLRSVACVLLDPKHGGQRAIGCITDVSEDIDGTRTDSNSPAPDPDGPAPPNPLTTMERECLAWVAAGKTAWETSVILERSRKTVEFHLANAVRKLDASNKVHAMALAMRQGLI